MIHRGAKPPTTVKTPGQAVAFLAGLNADKDFRPPGWQQIVTSLLNHELPYLRVQALQQVRLPLSDAAAALVAARIKDEYAPAQDSAIELAGESKLARFRQPLIDELKTTANESVVRKAFEAARACGAHLDRLLEILVGRLESDSVDSNELLLDMMIDAAIEDGEALEFYAFHKDWQSFLGDMQKAWREFIAANRQTLREGKRVKVGYPPLRHEMFPPE